MRREDSRLSLAASHLPIPNGSNRENRSGPTSTADLLRPLRFEQPGTVGREELIGRGWLFDEVKFFKGFPDQSALVRRPIGGRASV